MERFKHYESNYSINAFLVASLLFLGACGADSKPQPLVPKRILCPNGQDYVDVQQNGYWYFVDEENVNGQTVEEFRKGNMNSYSEAISHCIRDEIFPSTLP